MIMSIIGMNKADDRQANEQDQGHEKWPAARSCSGAQACELLRASNISAAERKASANAFFCSPIDEAGQAIEKPRG